MRGQEILSLLISLFYISATVLGDTEEETVTGLFSKDCILPCAFPRGADEVIHWTKGDKNVHSYYRKKDQLAEQDLNYRNRTYLFHHNIPHGNASLKLGNLTVTDEGRYKCYVGTQQDKKEVEVVLHVRVPSYYALEYLKTDTERTLRCYAFLTYPTPHISWMQGNKPTQETGRQDTRDGVLYYFRSDKNIINTTDPYYCRVRLPQEEWYAEWRMQDQLSDVEGSRAVIPCEVSSSTANTQGFSVVWTLTRNAATSVLASFNGTSHSYQPGVQINQSDFSLILDDLTADDSGEYVCNISSPRYTKLSVTTLQVENSSNTVKIVLGGLGGLGVLGVLIGIATPQLMKHRKKQKQREKYNHCNTQESDSSTQQASEHHVASHPSTQQVGEKNGETNVERREK